MLLGLRLEELQGAHAGIIEEYGQKPVWMGEFLLKGSSKPIYRRSYDIKH